ncbi:hypothetical protein CCMA1212_009745 [Trichoderma ghanense]|uniref:SSCRP protein n=1 Tax=Trichoderma ghanense TaxID=65468 RepID=A0ABY2GS13_9HYPO
MWIARRFRAPTSQVVHGNSVHGHYQTERKVCMVLIQLALFQLRVHWADCASPQTQTRIYPANRELADPCCPSLQGQVRVRYGSCYGAYLTMLGSADRSETTLNNIGPHLCFVQVSRMEVVCPTSSSYMYRTLPGCLANSATPSKQQVGVRSIAKHSEGRFQNCPPDFHQKRVHTRFWKQPLAASPA